MREVGYRRQLELHGPRAIVKREPLLMRRLEVVRQLGDRVANIFEILATPP